METEWAINLSMKTLVIWDKETMLSITYYAFNDVDKLDEFIKDFIHI